MASWALPAGCGIEQRRLEYDTLPLAALRRKLREELCSEELRMLYVALTRARERLILVGTVSTTQDKFCAKEVMDLEDGRLPAAAVRGGSTYLDWIVMALLHHPDGSRSPGAGGLRRGIPGLLSGTLPDLHRAGGEIPDGRGCPGGGTAPA
ncbi:MAG: hypothetical protein V8Q30_10430 [Acutalibacteraceae bacterium]